MESGINWAGPIWVYRGCQKNVPVFKRFILQPLMPHFRIPEHYYGKRYKMGPAGWIIFRPQGRKQLCAFGSGFATCWPFRICVIIYSL